MVRASRPSENFSDGLYFVATVYVLEAAKKDRKQVFGASLQLLPIPR